MHTITQTSGSVAQQARQRIERRQAMTTLATSNALLVRRRDVVCTALALVLIASGFALFVVSVILNSTYWADLTWVSWTKLCERMSLERS